PTVLWQDWVVYFGNTSKASFSSTTDWIPVASMTQVFAGTIPANVTANVWMELTLPTPFLWDGISNLVIAVDENTPNWGNTPHGQAIQQQQIRAFTITMILQIPTP
ncbi:MAG TPA: hypothetical protein PK337_11440, partial [Bacteroidia bacterium]|nr:hypothetical protein [Bacteroidia bacterium]